MSKKDLIRALGKKTGYTKSDIEVVLDAMEEVMVETLREGDEVKLFHGVTFLSEKRDARTYKNPATGEPIAVPEKMMCRVKVTPTFRDRLN